MPLKLSNEVQRQLEAINLESLASKLEALGVRSVQDLALVDDADLVRWGLSTIERRRFFGHVRLALGESGSDVLTPPSALTSTAVPGREKAAGARARRPESTTSSVGPARLDELVGRGSAEYQVPRLAERLLASTGPIDISELALRISRTAPALSQGYAADEWPMFIEACVRGYKRLQVEDGVLEGDRAIVSICSTVLFTASEEVVADTVSWARIVTCLATPAQVAVVTCLCRASREVADGPQVWSKLLSRWYPKATLLNPDWVAQTDLEKRLEEALENDYALAALTKRLDPDKPWDIGDLMRALPQQTTPKALVKFMSGHPEHFRQSPDGKKFCVSRTPEDLRNCKDWRTVNPFQMPPLPKKLVDSEGDSSGSARRSGGAPPAPSPYGRPKELKIQQAQTAANSGGSAVETPETKQEACQQLDPKVAFRLYHTGLLSQRSDHSKRGKLEAWEYYTESNSKCTMAAGDLLDLAESRVRAIRSNDPAVVHELVCQTIEGMVFKVPFGFWHRRVRVLTMGLSASQLRIGREQRKKLERKLLEFMEWVKKERGFGYYQCDLCKSRWKSGFSYEEITQQCLQCGNWQRPYRIQDLESAQEREMREKGGEGVPEEGRGPLPGRPTPSSRQHGGAVNMHMVPAVMFEMPILEHGREDRGQKRAWPGQPSQQPWQRPRFESQAWPGRSGSSGGDSWAPPSTPHVPRHVPPLRPQREAPTPPAAAAPKASSPAAENSSGPRYTPGGGGFFSRSGPSSASTAPSGSSASSETAATSARYTPGSGGFFSQRSSSATTGPPEDQRPRVDTAAAARIVAHNTERAAPATTMPATASVPSADAKASSSETGNRYKPGGGGFFSSRQSTTSQASAPGNKETDEDGVFAKARDAANSLLAELGALLPPDVQSFSSAPSAESAGSVKRGGILKSSKEPEVKAVANTAPVKSAPAPAAASSQDGAAEVAASLGLSVEEAQALGLLGNIEDSSSKPAAASAAPAAASASAPGAATARNSTPAAQTATATPPAERPATSYKPGGGGFFAARRGGSSSSSSSSAPAVSSNATSADEPSTAAAPVRGASASAGGADTAESAAPAEQPAPRYRPGGGGFFGARSSAEPGNAVAANAASPAAQGGGAARVEPSTPAGRPAYKAGGGGFFANCRGSSNSSSSDTHAGAAASSALPEAAAAVSAADNSTEMPAPSAPAAAASAATAAPPAKAESAAPAKQSTPVTTVEPVAESTPPASPPVKPAEEAAGAAATAAATMAPAADVSAAATPSPATAAEPVSEASKASTQPTASTTAPAETVEKPAGSPARYKAGGGGFFGRKSSGATDQAEPAKAPAVESDAALAPAAATEATPSAAPPASAPVLPADKLLALQTLGLSLDEAIKMGILPASYAGASLAPADSPSSQAAPAAATAEAAPAAPAAAPAAVTAAASSTSAAAANGDVDMVKADEGAEERAAKRRREDELAQEDMVRQDEIRRREAAAKYAAARRAREEAVASGSSTSASTSAAETSTEPSTASGTKASEAEMAVDQDGEALSIDYAAIAGGSDEALVEAVNAVVTFTGTGEHAGSTRVIAVQASDVAFLLSDDVFWPLLRRLAAETLALEAGARDLEAAWVAAPASSEAAVQHAESRGYCLPGGSTTAATSAAWRRALLTEVATELMLLRLRVGHGFDLPALAGPAADNSKWEERPAESLEGLASKVQGASGEGLAKNIIGDLERTANGGAPADSIPGKPLLERLATVSQHILGQQSRWAAAADGTRNGPALRGKWSLLQEMSVREAAASLRREYGVRRQILLRRLDVTVEALRACDKMTQPVTQRKFSDILSRMWAGWRRSAAEAPPLSEWSALAAARGMLTRAMSARVSGPGARVSSAVKKVTIGTVPDRGGVPDGYVKDGSIHGGSASSSAPAPKAAAQGQRPRLARTLRGGNTAGDAAGSSSTGQPGAATQAAGSASERGPASVGVKPRDKKGDGKGGTQVGARSTNKELRHQHHAQLKKEREEGKTNTYYAELGQIRYGGNPGE